MRISDWSSDVCSSDLGVFENSSGQPFNPGSVAAILDDRLQNISLQSLRGMDASIKYSSDVGDRAKVCVGGALTYLDSTRQVIAGQPEMAQSGLIFRPPSWRGKLSGTWQQARSEERRVGKGGVSPCRTRGSTYL